MTNSSEKKHVLLIDLGAAFGGAEIYLENLVRPLCEHVTFVALCAHPEISRRLRALGIEVVILPCATGLAKIVQLFCALCLLPVLVARHRIDTVQVNGYAEIVLLPL